MEAELNGRIDFQYIFLVGAGASISSNIPDALTMCRHIQENHNINEEEIQKYMNRNPPMNRYQATFRIALNKLDDRFVSRFVREQIKNARRPAPDYRWIINNFYNTIAEILTFKLNFSRLVVTTNFDPLIYYAFIQNWSNEPILIRHYEELKSMRPKDVQDEFPSIIYIHGYWQNHWMYHEPSALIAYVKQWVPALSKKYHSHDVIVIGYSGLEDSIALEWLKECLKKGRTIWWGVHSLTDVLGDTKVSTILKRFDGSDIANLIFFPIKTADKFALDLGKSLGLEQASKIHCIYPIFSWFKPISVDQFSSGAKLEFEVEGSLILKFTMGSDPFPGNNHAGFNIDTVYHELNLKEFKGITIFYSVVNSSKNKDSPGFEFKLHSKTNAWSYYVPLKLNEESHTILLEKFREQGVDLSKIWRIVIAADVKCLGKNGHCTIKIFNTELF